MLKGMEGKADMLEQAEDELKELQKKKPVHSLGKDCVSVAQAEQKLEKKLTEQSDLEKTHAASVKSLKEDGEMRSQAIQKEYVKEKRKREEEVEQEKVKLKETKVEMEEMMAQTKLALENVTAATTGKAKQPEDGLPSAAPGGAPGVVLVPAVPGNMIHSNDVILPELQDIVYNHPRLSGITPDMVVAFTTVIMEYMQMKSTVVAAGPSGAEPPREGTAEASQQVVEGLEREEDPMTSDEEENELIEANKKEGDTLEKERIRRSVKAARKAKSGKTAAATSVVAPVVKATIAKAAA